MSYSKAIKDPKCKEAYNSATSSGKGLTEACWKGYEAIGMKQKGKKKVPNCVPITGGRINRLDRMMKEVDDRFRALLADEDTDWQDQYDELEELISSMQDDLENLYDAEENDEDETYYTNQFIQHHNEAVAILDEIEQIEGGALKDYATAIIKGRNDYPPKMRDIIAKYGDIPILRMTACRTPVPSLLTSALNVVSLGAFYEKFKNTPYDKLFHLDLRLELALKPRTTILIEKNEVLNAVVNPKTPGKNTECSLIPKNKQLTLSKLLEGAKQIQGDKFFKYSAYDNNCQDFIMAVLKGSGVGNEDNFTFIKQDTKELFKDLPGTRKFANTVTDLGAVVNTIVEGAGAGAVARRPVRRQIETAHLETETLGEKERAMLNDLERHMTIVMEVMADQANENRRITPELWEEYNTTKFLIELAKMDLEKALNPVSTTADIEGSIPIVVPETFDIDNGQEIQEPEATQLGTGMMKSGISQSVYNVFSSIPKSAVIPLLIAFGLSGAILYGYLHMNGIMNNFEQRDIAQLIRMGYGPDRRRVAAEIIQQNNLNREQVNEIQQAVRDIEAAVPDDMSQLDSSLHSSDYELSGDSEVRQPSSVDESGRGVHRGTGSSASVEPMGMEEMIRREIREVEQHINNQQIFINRLQRLPNNDERRVNIPNALLALTELRERYAQLNDYLENMPVQTTAQIAEVPIVDTLNAEDVDESQIEDINEPEARQLGTGIHKGENYYIQSVVFDKNKFDVKQARKWLKENAFKINKPDVTDTQIRFRQVNPRYIKQKGFTRFRTKKIGRKSGISLIISYK